MIDCIRQPININDETSTFLANVLWYLFVPWHVYRIKCLPVTRAEPNEDALAFAQRVMASTAHALAQDATPFLYRDKIAYTRYRTRQIQKQKK
jgi:ancient ubiquitous protein 1